ncbi:EamA family transporter RarD [Marinovum sp.]|uniref:EamA family transporter RarD n=1 Tax=Marinovum sp. TaxID=2024839 RepID=UPI002B26C0B2|nr:EamA family transporter RarD [Marinovum sp.]
MTNEQSASRRGGILAMVAACCIWGLSGLYYRMLAEIPALEVLAHRTLWSAVFFAVVIAVQGRLGELRAMLAGRGVVVVALAALMISTNWFFFIWSVSNGHATEASLGYYIFPLVAVLLGRLVFGERLSRAQWLAVGLAATAVALLTWGLGAAPWISLVLAFSFGFYGLIKKQMSAGPVISVTGEVLVLVPIALVVIMLSGSEQGAGLARLRAVGTEAGLSWGTLALLIGAGPLTAMPLILFSTAARRVPMATVGLVQYLNPTLQFLVAMLIFAEPVSQWHGVAFPMIWAALAIYTLASLGRDRAERRLARQSSTEAVLPQNRRNEGSAKP